MVETPKKCENSRFPRKTTKLAEKHGGVIPPLWGVKKREIWGFPLPKRVICAFDIRPTFWGGPWGGTQRGGEGGLGVLGVTSKSLLLV